jgi:hypothetical protein
MATDLGSRVEGAVPSPPTAVQGQSASGNVVNLSTYRGLDRSSSKLAGAQESGSLPMATEAELRAAEIAAAEARTDTKITRLEGKMDLVLESIRSSRDEARDNRRSVIANAWVIFGALIVVIGILVTVAPAILDFGFKWRETITNEVHEQVSRVPPAKPQQ